MGPFFQPNLLHQKQAWIPFPSASPRPGMTRCSHPRCDTKDHMAVAGERGIDREPAVARRKGTDAQGVKCVGASAAIAI